VALISKVTELAFGATETLAGAVSVKASELSCMTAPVGAIACSVAVHVAFDPAVRVVGKHVRDFSPGAGWAASTEMRAVDPVMARDVPSTFAPLDASTTEVEVLAAEMLCSVSVASVPFAIATGVRPTTMQFIWPVFLLHVTYLPADVETGPAETDAANSVSG
jgi:hypothetical protein